MTLSLNPSITEEAKNKTTEIKLENTDIIAQNKPLPTENTQTQEPQQNTNRDVSTLSQHDKIDTQHDDLTRPSEQSEETNAQNAQAEQNPLLNDKGYQDYIKTKLQDTKKAQQAINIQRLKDESILPEALQKASVALASGYAETKYGIDLPKHILNSWQKQGDASKEIETTIYDYIAKYGEEEARKLGLQNIDKDLIKKAQLRQSLYKKDSKDLSEEEKNYLRDEQTIAGRLWDKAFHKEDKNIAEYQRNETRKQINSKLVNDLVQLHSISTSFMDLVNSKEKEAEQKNQFLKEGTQLAKQYGYDALVYDKKAKQYALIKEGKKYYPDIEGGFRNFDKMLTNNYYDMLITSGSALTMPFTGGASAAAGIAAKTAIKQGIKQSLLKEASKAGALSLAGNTIDYVENSKDLNREVKLDEMAKYAVGNAVGTAAATLGLGLAIKGGAKVFNTVKDIKNISVDDLKNIKVKNILDNEEMAINRKLSKFDKKEIDSNYEAFKNIQSNTVISKDIREEGMLGSFIDKMQQYNPLDRFTSKKETQEKLMASIFSNRELGKEFAGQLTGEEAQIIHKAVGRMGDNFSRLSKEYEEQLLNEYVKSGKTNVENIPTLYKELLNEIDKEAKQNYNKAINNLNETLKDTDFKNSLLQGYKNITDDAIDRLGFENELTRTLIRETQRLENKPNINLSEAIELRKDLNEIIRNYEKNSSDLKKFRAKEYLDNLKTNIDTEIKNALDSKVIKSQNEQHHLNPQSEATNTNTISNTLTKQDADNLFNEFMNANANYAKVKESLKDKFSQAITKGMNKKDLDSRLTTEQWKKRVLDTNWGESVKGLENTIFKNFNPKMQDHTQMLLIFRALDKNISGISDDKLINMGKILQDLEKLESLTLAPKVRPVLDLFKKYANAYRFAEEIGRAKGLEMMHGGGAMATTLEGRMKVFMTNRLFKKVFAYIPYLGDNNAILKSLSKAIKNLKYPSEITLETLNNLKQADLQKGYKPNKSNNEIPLKDITEAKPKTDKELQEAIKGNGRILDSKTQNELETLATNEHLLRMENEHKYQTQTQEIKEAFLNNLPQTREDLNSGNFVAKDSIKQDKELINLINEKLETNPAYTPDKVALHLQHNNESYVFIQDKNQISYIYKLENQTQPKTYDELMQRQRQETKDLESYKAQTQEILERREAEILKKEQKLELQNITKNTETKLETNLKNENVESNAINKIDSIIPTQDTAKTIQNQTIMQNITQKTQELEKINQKIDLQTTQKGKKYFIDRKNALENEIQDLEIQVGMRTSKTENNNRVKRQDIQDIEYTFTTKDNDKIILTEAEKKEISDRLKLSNLTQLKQISNNVSKMLDSKIILDLPKYMKSVDTIKARQIKELENALYNPDIALKDSNDIYLLTKYGNKYFTLKGTKENENYYIRGNKNLTENEIIDKVKSGSVVLASNNANIKSMHKTLEQGQSIPFTKLRETSIQTEKMKEAISADYVVIKKQHLNPNFTSENGLQYRNIKQDNVIKDIQENLNVNKLVNQEGGFQGLPLIQHDGQIIAGNHRGAALQGLNEISRKNYEKAIKDKFNIDLKSDEIVVRRINDNVDKDKILQLAKASNEGLENSLQEAVYTKLAKYEQHIKEIKDLHSQNLETMKQEVNSLLKGGPTDVGETNLALLASQVKDTKNFIRALTAMQKKPAFEKMYNMIVDNAGSFYTLGKKYPELKINELLEGSLNVLALAKEDTRDIFKNLADELALYLKSSNREAIQEQRKMMGLNADPVKDFKSEILGATLKRYIINNTNPSEHLFDKIKSFQQIAEEMKGPQLFGNAYEVNDTLFISHLYSNVSDTSRDINFLLKVADAMENLEKNRITKDDITDSNVKKFIEKLPKQKNETKTQN